MRAAARGACRPGVLRRLLLGLLRARGRARSEKPSIASWILGSGGAGDSSDNSARSSPSAVRQGSLIPFLISWYAGRMHLAKGWSLVVIFPAVLAAGCGLKLQMVDASVRKPSNVAVYFTVDTHDNRPVANLTPQDFRIYEDKQPVSILESKQTILQPEVAAIHYTLLLVDMSGSVVDSGDMPTLIEAASSFGERVGPYQKVAVYSFDGSPHLTPVVPFGGNVRGGVTALAMRRPRDPSTNLNGAVIEGVRLLTQQMERAPVPLRFGTLVVFTDGTDRAHRASPEDVDHALDSAGFET